RVERVPGHGTPTFSRAFYRAYRTSDGWIAVAAYAERIAARFCEAVGMPGLLDAAPGDERPPRGPARPGARARRPVRRRAGVGRRPAGAHRGRRGRRDGHDRPRRAAVGE